EVLNEAFKMCDSDKARASLSYLRDVFNRLSQLELDAKINIDLGLVHRNSYYTGVVFRGYIEGSGITVLTGGRYDSLMDEFGYPLESTGFAVDVDVLATAMLSRGEVRKSKPADILVFGQDGYEVHALKYISELTQKGFICENSTLSTEEESLNYAKLKGIKRMVTVCGDKIKEKKV
ncbi:MAG: ATP phosphoribosyltransferase regulatory subunit, partial [Oscillospiraceae bacterium]|nr:ATP phosphoribosyltransferase regulatory subunit [Oscillospiraceae bacterium]